MIYLIIFLITLCTIMLVVPVLYTYIKKEEIIGKYPFIMKFLNRYVLDRLTVKHNFLFGFTLFCGRQGGGKTYSAVNYCYERCKKYGSILISNTPLNPPANINYFFMHSLEDINYLPKSDSYVIFLDEIQTLFDCRKFDNEFYNIFCQLRKRNITLVGTAQVFERVALPLREQVHTLYSCRTYFGCVTRIKEFFPYLNSSGKLSSKNTFGLGTKYFVQTDTIRKMYDTFYKI